jgi:hypothetical protein
MKKIHSLMVHGRQMDLYQTRYLEGNRIALELVESGEPFLFLTVNFPDAPLARGEFAIKNWSENEPYIADIMASGLFVDTGKRISSGFVQAPVWRFA